MDADEESPTVGSGGQDDVASNPPDETSEEARNILELETTATGVGSDGMPFAPMMTYQKYLTMQVCRDAVLSCVGVAYVQAPMTALSHRLLLLP